MNSIEIIERGRELPPLAYIHSKVNGRAKPTVVYCHGFCNDMDMDKPKMVNKVFTDKGYSFIRFDFTDHGRSTFPCKDGLDPNKQKLLRFKQWKKDLETILDKLTQPSEEIIFVGDSMGAWIQIVVALERGESLKLRGMCGISTGVDFLDRFMKSFFIDSDKARIERGEILWMNGPYGPYVGAKQLVDDSNEFLLLNKKKIALHCPCRFVHRLGDVVIPPEWIVQLVSKIEGKDVQVEYTKGGDHRMIAPEDFEAIRKAVDSLLLAIR